MNTIHGTGFEPVHAVGSLLIRPDCSLVDYRRLGYRPGRRTRHA